MESEYVEIDGVQYEGGGQILRFALALSLIKHRSVRIYNIRGGRKSPGLAESHLTALNFLASSTNSQVTGNTKGSTYVTFVPGEVKSGTYKINCRTAGSIALIFQAVLPVFLNTKSSFVISGGTDVDFSPCSHFITHVLVPFLANIGIHITYTVEKYGFYPSGQGRVRISIESSSPHGLTLLENQYFDYHCELLHTFPKDTNQEHLNFHVQELERIKGIIQEKLEISEERFGYKYINAKDKNIVASLWCETSFVPVHVSFINNFRNSEISVQEKCSDLKKEISDKNCVDQFLQDQMLIYLTIADSPSQIFTKSLTPHTQAVISLVHQFNQGQIIYQNNILHIIPSTQI
jgi:RNA 3'-terminal phosphate cyclase (ATP)